MIILVFPLQYFKCLLACVVPNKLFFVPLHLMYLLFFFLAKIIHFSMTFLLLWICLISYISVSKLQAWTFSITNFLNRFLDIANAFTSHSRIPTAKSGCMITSQNSLMLLPSFFFHVSPWVSIAVSPQPCFYKL